MSVTAANVQKPSIRLYDYELSGSCYKVRLLLGFLGRQWEPVPIDFVGREHKSENLLALNPFGELPIIEDGEVRLRDAQAILVYLAGAYDKARTWYPTDSRTQGLIQQWLSTGGGPLMAVSAARLTKALRYPRDMDALHRDGRQVLGILDAHLAKRDFLVNDLPTIADIACFPYAALAPEAGIDLADYAHLVAWVVRIRQLPGFTPMPGISALTAQA
jgi:glutathione S-transferase